MSISAAGTSPQPNNTLPLEEDGSLLGRIEELGTWMWDSLCYVADRITECVGPLLSRIGEWVEEHSESALPFAIGVVVGAILLAVFAAIFSPTENAA